MDSTTFDTVTRNLSSVVNRRSALRGLMAGALAVTAGSSALETSAKRRKAKKQRRLQPGDFCQKDTQCNHHDPHYTCGRRVFNDEQQVCCGLIDAVCRSGADCCYGYLCLDGLCVGV